MKTRFLALIAIIFLANTPMRSFADVNEGFQVKDMVDIYNGSFNAQAAFYSFYSVVAFGIWTLLWSAPREKRIKSLAVTGFALFCLCDGLVMERKQMDLVVISRGLQCYIKTYPQTIPDEFKPAVQRLVPFSVRHCAA
jgi:hypothetical protein